MQKGKSVVLFDTLQLIHEQVMFEKEVFNKFHDSFLSPFINGQGYIERFADRLNPLKNEGNQMQYSQKGAMIHSILCYQELHYYIDQQSLKCWWCSIAIPYLSIFLKFHCLNTSNWVLLCIIEPPFAFHPSVHLWWTMCILPNGFWQFLHVHTFVHPFWLL